jgi:thymidylate synthase (FAD)
MLDAKIRPQEARSVLPNALAATIAVTGNLRNWRHLLLMRTSKETHPDFKEVTIPLLVEFRTRVPLLFDDIVADTKQSINMRLPR